MASKSGVVACVIAVCAPGAVMAQENFTVGQAVELEASGHWVPCVVTEPDPQLVRAQCEEYPELSRAAGVYMAQNDPASIRAATGQIGLPPAAPAAAAAAPIAGLRQGEYACVGSGGTIMIGLGFIVTGEGRYTDLDGGNAGRYTVRGGNVSFRGGHLDGQTGRELDNGEFRIGAQANCGPW